MNSQVNNQEIPEMSGDLIAASAEEFERTLALRSQNHAAIIAWCKKNLIEGVDFGSIQTKRGPSKPSLFKPGAEKVCSILGVTVHYPNLSAYEQVVLSGRVIDAIVLRCELRNFHSRVVAEGVGARNVKQDFGDLNKSLKMAEKSAQIDATLRLAGLSDVFTQDLEDMKDIKDMKTPGSSGRAIERPLLQILEDMEMAGTLDELREILKHASG